MDPLTQATLGAVAAQPFIKKTSWPLWTLVGMLGGMAADLDVLIESPTDPLLGLQYHRHFTHSLFFIPIGGALVAWVLYRLFLKKRQHSFKTVYFFSTVGYATHGLLDGCTSYGTQLMWPLSNFRYAWDSMPIIDPLFTLPLLGLTLFAAWKKNNRFSYVAVAYLSAYLSFGFYQHSRALSLLQDLLIKRNHQAEKVTAKPSFGSLLLWRTIYLANGKIYYDAFRLPYFSKDHQFFQGGEIAHYQPKPGPPKTVLEQDIARFNWFSDGYLARLPEEPDVLADMRYATLPQARGPLWGIRVDENRPDQHIQRVFYRNFDPVEVQQFWDLLLKGKSE